MLFLLLGDYKSPGFNRSNLFLRRISNPPGRLAGDFLFWCLAGKVHFIPIIKKIIMPKMQAIMLHSNIESTYKKCLREEWGKFTGYQLLSSFWLKVARTDEDRNTTRWDRGTLPIRNLYPKWGMLRFGRIKKVTNWIWILWFIVSY